MGEMPRKRRHLEGSWDQSTFTWKLRSSRLLPLSAPVTASVKKLRSIYGEEVPKTERGSWPFWCKFRDGIIAALRVEEQKAAAFGQAVNEKQVLYAIAAKLVTMKGGSGLEVTVKGQDTAPVRDSVRAEIKAYLSTHEKKNRHHWYELRLCLGIFEKACGDVLLRDVSIHNYRKFLELLEADIQERDLELWGVTHINRQRAVHTFLKGVESNYGLWFPFVRSAEFKKEMPDGKKVKYTLDELRTALREAKGLARLALLLGCNCGWYFGDIEELAPGHLVNGRVVKGRDKNKKKNKFIGQWKLWPETLAELQYGISAAEVEKAYNKLRSKFSLPEHMALRKTISQLIEDKVSERAARLYRAEKPGGNHGKYYSEMSPEQVAELDTALVVVRDWLLAENCL